MIAATLTGLRAVPGRCNAPAYVLLHLPDIQQVPHGCCLVLKTARPDVVLAFDRVAAIACEVGGVTSHLAILAREVGIPCIVGVGGLINACLATPGASCIFDEGGDHMRLEVSGA